jgi:3-hydroxy acid dehydrogenase/malonic semialdehyde reductase
METIVNDAGCILITGGSRGIGRACCDALAVAGINTVSLSRSPPVELPASETHYCVDLENLADTGSTIKRVLKTHSVTGVICNAGRGDIGSLENFSNQQIQSSLTFNLISPLCIVRQCLPTLRKQNRSDIVFIGSTSALQGGRYGTIYSAAKFGLRGIAQALSYEVAGANCHVGIVHPGMVRTDFFDALDFEPGPNEAHALPAQEVADSVLSMLKAPDNTVISELVVQPRQHVVQKRQQ